MGGYGKTAEKPTLSLIPPLTNIMLKKSKIGFLVILLFLFSSSVSAQINVELYEHNLDSAFTNGYIILKVRLPITIAVANNLNNGITNIVSGNDVQFISFKRLEQVEIINPYTNQSELVYQYVVPSSNIYNANTDYYLRWEWYREPNTGLQSADLIPVFNNIQFTQFEWWNNDYYWCENITITRVGSGTTLTNFPALINTSDSNHSAFVDQPCREGGSQLPSEVENFTADFTLYWVNVTLNADSITISRYMNENEPSSYEPERVWLAYTSVYHLQEKTGTRYDSTKLNNLTTVTGNTASSWGIIDGSAEFDGTGDDLRASDSSSLDALGTIGVTVEAWVNADTLTQYDTLVEKTDNSWTSNIHLYYDTNNMKNCIDGYVNCGSVAFTETNEWVYIVGTWDKANINIYKNTIVGTPKADSSAMSSNNELLLIGGESSDNYDLDGELDEVRLSDSAKTIDWINQSYQMVINQTVLVVFGDGEPQVTTTTSTTTTSSTSTTSILTTTIPTTITVSPSEETFESAQDDVGHAFSLITILVNSVWDMVGNLIVLSVFFFIILFCVAILSWATPP